MAFASYDGPTDFFQLFAARDVDEYFFAFLLSLTCTPPSDFLAKTHRVACYFFVDSVRFAHEIRKK